MYFTMVELFESFGVLRALFSFKKKTPCSTKLQGHHPSLGETECWFSTPAHLIPCTAVSDELLRIEQWLYVIISSVYDPGT